MDILLIEDNLTITKALTYTFETNGLTVKTVNNLTDAYDLTLAHYKLILLDVSLPDGSGFDFYKDMLSNKNIPTIFLTAKSLEDDVVKGLNLGAVDYITKPFSTRVLLAKINKYIKKENVVKVKNITFDFDKMEVYNEGNLVNTMLKLSMFEVNAIKFDRKYNSLKGILEKSIENVSMIMDLKNVKVNFDIKEDMLIKCDYNFEVEAISNILKNEVEYSKEFGKIDISVSDNKLYTTLIIKDYGIGISEKDLKNIFNRFYRGENSSSNSAGIGLSLAKKIILMDNGKISVESKKNEYTFFQIKYFK